MSLQLGGNGGISGCTSLSAPEVITVSGLIVGSGTTANQIGYGFRQGPNGTIVPVSNSGDVAYMYADPTLGSGVSTISINYSGTPVGLFPTTTIPSGRAAGGFQVKRNPDSSTVINGFLTLPADGVTTANDAYNGLGRGGTSDDPLPCPSGTALWLGYGHGFNGRNNQRGGYLLVRTSRDSAILATEIQAGGQYQIISVGSTDFTTIGAANNNIGTVFTASGPGTGDGTVQFNAGNTLGNLPTEIVFATQTDRSGSVTGSQSAVQRMIIRDDGTLDLLSSPGIKFGDVSGSVTGKTLEDYEEGTWTPTFVGGGSEGDGTYQSRGGKYVKVGDLVHVSCFIRFSNKGNISGDLSVGGLPFVQGSTGTASRASLCIGSLGNWNTRPTGCVIEASQNYANLNNAQDSSGNTLTEAAIANNSFIFLTGTYRTS